jgi:hypothetical protein
VKNDLVVPSEHFYVGNAKISTKQLRLWRSNSLDPMSLGKRNLFISVYMLLLFP